MPYKDTAIGAEKERARYHRLKHDPDWIAQKRKAVRESHARRYATEEGRAAVRAAQAAFTQGQIDKIGLGAVREKRNALSRSNLAKPEKRAHRQAYMRKYMEGYVPKPESKAAIAVKARIRLLKKRGLTEAKFELMMITQGNACAICRRTDNNGKPLFIDHDHATGVTRELLCHGCNGGLGHFMDDPALLGLAAAYLRKHGRV